MRTIREIGPEDEAALKEFLEENNRPEVTDLFHAFPFDAETARRICHAPRQDRYFAMFDEHGTMLCLGMMRGWDEGYDVPTLGIASDHRLHGKGHGHRLFLWGVELGKRIGMRRMRATTYETHTVVKKMLTRADFKQTGTLPGGRVEFFWDA